jgi:hypothetical protein
MLLFKKAIVKYYIKKNFFSREIYTHITHSTLILGLILGYRLYRF